MTGINTTYIQGYASSIVGLINGILVPVLISIAFIVFLWGVYKYFIKGASSETERATGKVFTLYGIIGFVILFSVWGIVQIFMGTLNLSATNVPSFPTIGGNSGSLSNTNTFFPGAGNLIGNGITWNTSQTQAGNALSQAFQAYSNCAAQNGASGCQSQRSAFNAAQTAYQNTGGGSYPLGKCIGGNDGVGGTCPSGYCSATGYCISNSGSEAGKSGSGGTCSSDTDCSTGLACDLDAPSSTYRKCISTGVSGGVCSADSDCTTGFVCDLDAPSSTYKKCISSGGSSQCTIDNDCAAGLMCDQSTNTCVGGGNVGDGSTGSACLVDNDCDVSGDFCDESTKVCASSPEDVITGGCMIQEASNYDPDADREDFSCTGCRDEETQDPISCY